MNGALERAMGSLTDEVQKRYPDLVLSWDSGRPLMRGSFPVFNGDEVIDRFSIEIQFPQGPQQLPEIREIGGRLPRIADRHIFPNDGTICTEVPERILLGGPYSLLAFLDGPVQNYFLGQLAVEQGDPWPFGEWSHGAAGLLQAYGEMLGLSDEKAIRRSLDYLGHAKIKGHWPCPCGSGSRLRDCHRARMRELQQNIPPRLARSALNRLKLYSGR